MVALVGGTLNFLVAEAHPRTRGAYLGVGQHRAVALPRAALLLLQMRILKHISISLAARIPNRARADYSSDYSKPVSARPSNVLPNAVNSQQSSINEAF